MHRRANKGSGNTVWGWWALLLSAAACAKTGQVAPARAVRRAGVVASASARCEVWAAPTAQGVVDDPSLTELSGLAASARHPGILWTHNDNGHKPRIYAIDGSGKRRASYKPKTVPNDDWEDIALGPCSREPILAGTPCLYLADTGDNDLNRTVCHVLRMPEPTPPAVAGEDNLGIDAKAVEVFAFTWPEGPEDCEAIAVLPDTRVLLFSKRNDGQSKVLRLTLLPDAKVEIESLGTLDLRDSQQRGGHSLRVTAADLAPDGRWLLLRTYGRVLLYDLGRALAGPATEARSAIQGAVAQRLVSAAEEHGEGIAWDPRGGFWQIAEGNAPTLWHSGCVTAKP